MAEEIIKNIQTMKRDLLRLKEEDNLLPREEIEKQKKIETERRLKIENEIKIAEDKERKKEEEELLRLRKEERKNDLEIDYYDDEEETAESKKALEEINKQIITRKKDSINFKANAIKEQRKTEEVKEVPPPPPPPPEPPKPKELTKGELLEKIKGLEQEREGIALKIKDILEKKQPINQEKNVVLSELDQVRKSFQEVVLKEQEIEESQKALEEKELLAESPKDKRKIEKERWAIEEKRREIEQKRWPWDQKIKSLDDKIKEIEEKSLDLNSLEIALKNKLEDIANKEAEIQKKIERIELKKEVEQVKEAKISIEKEKSEVATKIEELDKQITTISNKEKDVEEEKSEIEQKEASEKDITKKRELETERWKVEEKRRKIETERWKVEETKNALEIKAQKVEERMNLILEKEKSLLAEISPEEPKPLEIVEEDAKEEVPEPAVAESSGVSKEVVPVSETVDRDSGIEEAQKRIEMLRKAKKPAVAESSGVARPEPEKEVKDKIKESPDPQPKAGPPRAERDLEKERLIAQENRRKELLGRLKSPLAVQSRDNVLPKPKELVKKLPKKPSGGQKIWLRIAIAAFIIIVLTAILTFWYWYFRVKDPNPPAVENQVEETLPPEVIEVRTFTELDYIFNPQDEIMIEKDEMIDFLTNILQEEQIDDKFVRVTIKDVGFKEFAENILLTMPEEFYEKASEEFIFYVYSQPQGKRFGLVVKINNPTTLEDVLKIQETTMEQDFSTLFQLSGQTAPAIVSYFRNSSDASGYEGPDFRYKTVNKEDVGICYAVSDNYFILGSSWKSMETLLSKLN